MYYLEILVLIHILVMATGIIFLIFYIIFHLIDEFLGLSLIILFSLQSFIFTRMCDSILEIN